MGGTIDSTGAVAAAGASLGEVAEQTAATVKMIQNILIGVTAFGVAMYWVMFVERRREWCQAGCLGDLAAVSKIRAGLRGGLDHFHAAEQFFGWWRATGANDRQTSDQGHARLVLLSGIRQHWFGITLQRLEKASSWRQAVGALFVRPEFESDADLAMAYLMFGVIFADYIQEMLAK